MYVRRNGERDGATGAERGKERERESRYTKVRGDLMQFQRTQTNDEQFSQK